MSGASGLRRTVGRTDRDDGTAGLHARQKHRVHGIHVSSARAESRDYTNLHVEATHTTTYIGALSGYRPINGIFRSLIRLLLTFRIIAHANLEPGLISDLTFFPLKTFIAKEDPSCRSLRLNFQEEYGLEMEMINHNGIIFVQIDVSRVLLFQKCKRLLIMKYHSKTRSI